MSQKGDVRKREREEESGTSAMLIGTSDGESIANQDDYLSCRCNFVYLCVSLSKVPNVPLAGEREREREHTERMERKKGSYLPLN